MNWGVSLGVNDEEGHGDRRIMAETLARRKLSQVTRTFPVKEEVVR